MIPDNDVEPLLDVKASAEFLNVTRQTVWDLIKAGDLPAVRLSPRRIRISRADLERFLTERRTTQ